MSIATKPQVAIFSGLVCLLRGGGESVGKMERNVALHSSDVQSGRCSTSASISLLGSVVGWVWALGANCKKEERQSHDK